MSQEIETLKKDFESAMKGFSERLENLSRAQSLTALEKGKWYKFTGGGLANYQSERQHFGFSSYGDWMNPCSWFDLPKFNVVAGPATKEEVESALIKEAERRGFKEGVIMNVDWYEGNHELNSAPIKMSSEPYNGGDECALRMGGACIYSNGKWATIVKGSPITICGKEVNFETFRKDIIEIGGNHYSRANLNDALHILSLEGVHSINVGCSGQEKVTKETIQSIIDKIK